MLKTPECDIHAIWEGGVYSQMIQSYPVSVLFFITNGRPIAQVWGEKEVRRNHFLLNTCLSVCCLPQPRTVTNLTGFDYEWNCIKTHYCLEHSKLKTERI